MDAAGPFRHLFQVAVEVLLPFRLVVHPAVLRVPGESPAGNVERVDHPETLLLGAAAVFERKDQTGPFRLFREGEEKLHHPRQHIRPRRQFADPRLLLTVRRLPEEEGAHQPALQNLRRPDEPVKFPCLFGQTFPVRQVHLAERRLQAADLEPVVIQQFLHLPQLAVVELFQRTLKDSAAQIDIPQIPLPDQRDRLRQIHARLIGEDRKSHHVHSKIDFIYLELIFVFKTIIP